MKKMYFLLLSLLTCSTLMLAQEENIKAIPIAKNTVGIRSGVKYNFYAGSFLKDKIADNLSPLGELFINRTFGRKQNWQTELSVAHFISKPKSEIWCFAPPYAYFNEPTHNLSAVVALRRKVLSFKSLNWSHFVGVTAGTFYSRYLMDIYYGEFTPTKRVVDNRFNMLVGIEYSGSLDICKNMSFQYLVNYNTFPHSFEHFVENVGLNFSVGFGYKF